MGVWGLGFDAAMGVGGLGLDAAMAVRGLGLDAAGKLDIGEWSGQLNSGRNLPSLARMLDVIPSTFIEISILI